MHNKTAIWDVSHHPARWTGPEMVRSTEWVYQFSSAEADELREFASRFVATGASPLTLIGSPVDLPVLAPALAGWREVLTRGRGFVLARGLPVASMGPAQVAAAYVALGTHLGTPVAQNAAGLLLGDIRDDGSDPDNPTVRRYRTRLEQPFHVDGADIVGLLCLHQAKSGGVSQVVSSVTIYDTIAALHPELIPLLSQTWYFDTYGNDVPGALNPWFERPLLTGTPERFSLFHLRWYVDRAQQYPGVPVLTSAHVELLDLIDSLAADPALHLNMDFAPGDIQLLSNHTILHSRTAYEDFEEPERKRHLLRLWLNAS
jgi:hypothetical protein